MNLARELRTQLVNVLTGLPKGFTFQDGIGHARFDNASFGKLAEALRAIFFDKVEVEVVSSKYMSDKFGGDAGAYYSPSSNTFGFLQGFSFSDPYSKSVAIHESIHAIQDGLELGYGSPDHEVVAYAGQALYFQSLTRGKKLSADFDTSGAGGKIFVAADKVAAEMASSGSLKTGTKGVKELRAAILGHPLYKPRGKKKKKIKGSGW